MNKKTTNNSENKHIPAFVRELGEKNYAEANKYLKKTIETKLSNKIKEFKNINIFRNE